ncbi:hypothetical protein CXF83_05690 [Shewanella sp. Choline-02u-19]|uniref:hypothetical protein n=1 Tax=unclassified Shewanella TaxID=196818 RepID=UPI000C34D4BE|nr:MULTISPECIES: hypothetical protein [unclassified Shewanella]PKG76133.1 hypothetical protein CXF86_04300 [Shewanella sp. GutCb]PKH56582.1 hypothetical protein CXF84_11710 [Shewanella sp. Bg11-22]PKI30133.1 hypothetical protein CXF83_05690 [Shewanella sp. Choline-02u-19]
MKFVAILSALFVLSACGSNASYSVSASSDDDVMSSRQAPMVNDSTPIINDELTKEAEEKEKK